MTTYSETSDRLVGKWIDDKPLYRRVVTFYSNTASTTVPHNIPNVDHIHILYFFADASDGSAMSFINHITWVGVNKTNIRIDTSGWTFGTYIRLIVEYTKTTD